MGWIVNQGDATRIVARLRELLARGQTLREAGQRLDQAPVRLHRLAVRYDLPRRRRQTVTPNQERQIAARLARAESVRVIARLVGVGKGTVHRRKQTRAERSGQPRRVAAYKCDGCGYRVNLQPCQICRVEKAGRGPPAE